VAKHLNEIKRAENEGSGRQLFCRCGHKATHCVVVFRGRIGNNPEL